LLEERLGTRLLQRPRALSLTDAGEALYLHCLAMLAEARAGEEAVGSASTNQAAQVRLSVPVPLPMRCCRACCLQFMQRLPQGALAVQASNRQVDLLEEGVDVVVRGVNHALLPSSLMQVPCAPHAGACWLRLVWHWVVFCSRNSWRGAMPAVCAAERAVMSCVYAVMLVSVAMCR
jgi:DNA-binding transcriptional LysR family regulator